MTTFTSGINLQRSVWSHDDGWYARIFYADWDAVDRVLRPLLLSMLSEQQAFRTLDLVKSGKGAFWCRGGTLTECEATEDIDSLQRNNRTS